MIYDVAPGENIYHAAEEMAKLAIIAGDCVECRFNDVLVKTYPCEPPDEIVRRYHSECERQRTL